MVTEDRAEKEDGVDLEEVEKSTEVTSSGREALEGNVSVLTWNKLVAYTWSRSNDSPS